MKRTKLTYFFIIALLFAFSCGQDPIIDPSLGPPALTAKINGEEFSVDSVLVSARYSKIDESLQTLSVSGAPPAFDGVVEGIALSFISADSTDIQSGESYVPGSLSKRGAGTYFVETNNSSRVSATSENTQIGIITLTEIDFVKKIVSGTFSFDAIDEDDPSKVYQVRDGEFKNVSFD